MQRRGRGRRRRSKRKSSPDERTARTQRSRRRNVHLALCRAERHVGGVGAREAASRKPDVRGESGERIWGSEGESRARVRRGRFSGLRHGRGYGVREGRQPCLGFAGSRWVRYQATFVRRRVREATYGEWVPPPGRRTPAKRGTGLGTGATEGWDAFCWRSQVALSIRTTPSATLNEAAPRDTRRARRGLA